MSLTIDDLPIEILIYILNFLSYKEIKALNNINRRFQEARNYILLTKKNDIHPWTDNHIKYAARQSSYLAFSYLNTVDVKLILNKNDLTVTTKLNAIDYYINVLNKTSEYAIFFLNATRRHKLYTTHSNKIAFRYWSKHDEKIAAKYLEQLITNINKNEYNIKILGEIIPLLKDKILNNIIPLIIDKISFTDYEIFLKHSNKITLKTAKLLLTKITENVKAPCLPSEYCFRKLIKIFVKHNNYCIINTLNRWPEFQLIDLMKVLKIEYIMKYLPIVQIAKLYQPTFKTKYNSKYYNQAKSEIVRSILKWLPEFINYPPFYDCFLSTRSECHFRTDEYTKLNKINPNTLIKLIGNKSFANKGMDIIALNSLISRKNDISAIKLEEILLKIEFSPELLRNNVYAECLVNILKSSVIVLNPYLSDKILSSIFKFLNTDNIIELDHLFYILTNVAPNMIIVNHKNKVKIQDFIYDNEENYNYNRKAPEVEYINLNKDLLSKKIYSEKIELIFDFVDRYNFLSDMAIEYLNLLSNTSVGFAYILKKVLARINNIKKRELLVNKTLSNITDLTDLSSDMDIIAVAAEYLTKSQSDSITKTTYDNRHTSRISLKILSKKNANSTYLISQQEGGMFFLRYIWHEKFKFHKHHCCHLFKVATSRFLYNVKKYNIINILANGLTREEAEIFKQEFFVYVGQAEYHQIWKKTLVMASLINFANTNEIIIFYNAVLALVNESSSFIDAYLGAYKYVLQALKSKMHMLSINIDIILDLIENNIISQSNFYYIRYFLDVIINFMTVEQTMKIYDKLIQNARKKSFREIIDFFSNKYKTLSSTQTINLATYLNNTLLKLPKDHHAERYLISKNISKLLWEQRDKITNSRQGLSIITQRHFSNNMQIDYIRTLYFYSKRRKKLVLESLFGNNELLPESLTLPPIPMPLKNK